MAVRVRLSDGVRFVVNAEIEDFTRSFQEALKKDELLEVENGSGKTRVVNPQQILYFEDAANEVSEDDPAAAASVQQPEDLPV